MTIILLVLHFYKYLSHFFIHQSEYNDSYYLFITNEFVLGTNLEVEVVNINIRRHGLCQTFFFWSKSSVLAKEWKIQQPNSFVFYYILHHKT